MPYHFRNIWLHRLSSLPIRLIVPVVRISAARRKALMPSALVAGFLLFSGACSSLQNYGADRARDFGDIFTLATERRVYGGNAMLGPFFAGLAYQSTGVGYGLRAGTTGHYRTGPGPDPEQLGNSVLLLNSIYHESLEGCRTKGKDFQAKNVVVLAAYDLRGHNSAFQIEVSLGLYAGIRLGLNLAELLDFILGITTLDVLSDDGCNYSGA